MRIDGRKNNEIREINIKKDFIIYPDGSVLIEMGKTRVICSAFVENKVPPFLKGTSSGWITAEYSMLPSSTQTRKIRASTRGKIDGRAQEIQRLIGRSLRSIVDLKKIGERTIWIDCDVIQADGGTRTASITGSFIVLMMALKKLKKEELIKEIPVSEYMAAVSVGIVGNEILLDLCYEEDSTAKVDMNVVMTESGKIIEIQGTGEESPFTREEMDEMIFFGEKGIKELVVMQKNIIEG